jgi:hypothetical protein
MISQYSLNVQMCLLSTLGPKDSIFMDIFPAEVTKRAILSNVTTKSKDMFQSETLLRAPYNLS